MLAGQQFGFDDPFTGLARAGSPATATQEVSQFRGGRDDRREVGHLPRGHGGVRGRVPRAGASGPRRGPLRARDRAARRRRRTTRARASRTGTRSARCPTLVEGGRLTAACRQPDLRRVGRAADRRASRRWPTTASRRGPASTTCRVRGDDPVCMLTAPIPATAYALEKTGHDARRHRPGRDQRGVRLGRARLAEGDRRRPGARSTSTAARSPSATRSAPPAPG